MLTVTIPETEEYDPKTECFYIRKQQVLSLEHSLVSLAKWESKWKKPFLSDKEKTREESIDYIRCMTITQNVDPEVYYRIPQNVMDKINEYIGDPMTATTFSDTRPAKRNNEVITAEIIYYWMVALQIPFECQKWHLNRLITLVRVCNIKNSPPEKMSKNDIFRRNAALNAARRKAGHTRG